MKALSGRDFARLVERHGYGKPGSVVRLSIPIHGSQPLKAGLPRHLAKLAEFPEDELS